ncbi:uncharacterized protein PAC_07034 [Phialocephala subalpina]|uniref:Acyltransferase 3 domain-containing protein n=1 Tax=Phialocephala subalpina TaxID=576137 RepID=A0A1L7WWJ9_9HELO|nr:uncharacterized protein PAC_07034 [Phialocephala subalpina]
MVTFHPEFHHTIIPEPDPELTISSKVSLKLRTLRTKPSTHPSQDYLLGLRGLLTIQAFIYTFLLVFTPTAVKDSHNSSGPGTQLFLRKTLSVLLWNASLIYSFIIVLSARCISIPFISSPTSLVVASSVFRRSVRLLIPTFVSSLLVVIFFSGGREHIHEFKTLTSNHSIETPYTLPGFVGFFNAIFNLFWVPRDFASQAGSRAFPGQMLWIVTLLYSQSWTVFMSMVIIPYTRPVWRVKAWIFFILTAWWVQSWAWFSITGLLLADVKMNMDFQFKSLKGLRVAKRWRVPSWILYGVCVAVGLMMQFFWVAWKPELADGELRIHADLYGSAGLNEDPDLRQPQARMDNYFVIVGVIGLLETSDFLQFILSSAPLLYLGRRSFAWFLTQSIIIYSVGIKLFLHLHKNGASETEAIIACLLVCVLTVISTAEVFYRLVEIPSQRFAKVAWEWMRV